MTETVPAKGAAQQMMAIGTGITITNIVTYPILPIAKAITIAMNIPAISMTVITTAKMKTPVDMTTAMMSTITRRIHMAVQHMDATPGSGPRGYQRSDERIEDDINDRLTWHGQLDATDVHVDVQDGVATLDGIVEDRRQKRIAEDVAESVSGVEDVNNQLKIKNRRWNRGQSGMNAMKGQVRPGMEVVGRDGDQVGEVKEVRSSDFLADRSMARDVYIPFSACQVTNGQIRLNIRADEVDNQDWEMPELLGSETSQGSQKNR